MNTEDLARLIQNLIRIGTVVDVDYAAPAVRVRTGELTTNWLKWAEIRAGQTTDWDPPTIDEQVVLLSPGGDLSGAIVIRGLGSDLIPPPSNNKNKTVRNYPDGAHVEYDHSASDMRISGIKTLLITASDSITFQAPNLNLLFSNTAITGEIIHSGGNLTSNGVTVHTHVHGGVISGGSDTQGPK